MPWLIVAVVVLVVLSTAAPAWSQSDVAREMGATDVRYFDFFVVKGGWIAYFIILLSVAAMALAIEHAVSIRRATIVPAHAIEELRTLIENRQYAEAVRFSAEDSSVIAYVINAALVEAPNGYGAMVRAVEEALEERSAKLYRKIEYLNIIGAVSPMMGLFGTVVGMILLFSAIHAADTFPRAQVVADKVSIALVATFWGLAVAIPSLSVYAVFRNRIEVMTAECAIAADRVLSVFKPNAERSAANATPATP